MLLNSNVPDWIAILVVGIVAGFIAGLAGAVYQRVSGGGREPGDRTNLGCGCATVAMTASVILAAGAGIVNWSSHPGYLLGALFLCGPLFLVISAGSAPAKQQ
jgi:hypothetical protein